MIAKEEFLTLVNQYLAGKTSAEEEAFLFAYYDLFMADADVMQLLEDQEKLKLKLQMKDRINQRLELENMPVKRGSMHGQVVKRIRIWPRIAAAVVVVLCLGIGYSLYLGRTSEGFRLARDYRNNIAPGKYRATITLSNGNIVQLSERKTGVVVGTELRYNDGTVVDNWGSLPATERKVTVATPRGGTYQITLPDGTRVWLNAESKLTFPAKFSGHSRLVMLQGEGYFEVVKIYSHAFPVRGISSRKEERMPFIVESKGQEVKVLGTHFNINAYADEAEVKTTLLEGSVMVGKPGKAEILKPGEQAVLNGKYMKVIKVDAGEAIAWKNGLFSYKNATLQTVMRQLSRWYDISVVFENEALKNNTLTGSVSRFSNISGMLLVIERTGAAKFKIEGKKITVY
jgi:transmembrane sensor